MDRLRQLEYEYYTEKNRVRQQQRLRRKRLVYELTGKSETQLFEEYVKKQIKVGLVEDDLHLFE